MDYDENQLTASAENARTIAISIGDACAAYIDANEGRDPLLVFGEVIAGLMAAAATIQAVTKRDPALIATEFEMGVRVAALSSPTACLGEKLRDAIKALAGVAQRGKVNAPLAPGIN